MTENHVPSDLGRQLMDQITRAVEGRILEEEMHNLQATIIALTEDRREPVDKYELGRLIGSVLPNGYHIARRDRTKMADRLLQMTVVTKLPHPVWGKGDSTDG